LNITRTEFLLEKFEAEFANIFEPTYEFNEALHFSLLREGLIPSVRFTINQADVAR